MRNNLGFYCSECGQPLQLASEMKDNGAFPHAPVAGEVEIYIKPCELCQKRASLRSKRAFDALSEALSYAKDEDTFVEMMKKLNKDNNI